MMSLYTEAYKSHSNIPAAVPGEAPTRDLSMKKLRQRNRVIH
jgi:hypothetical protein